MVNADAELEALLDNVQAALFRPDSHTVPGSAR
jgi:hypothetical protein